MFEKVRNTLLFYLKNIQFTLRTWQNATEIARAYKSSAKEGDSGREGTDNKPITVAVTIVVVCMTGAGAGYYFGIYRKARPVRLSRIDNELSVRPPVMEPEPAVSGQRLSSPDSSIEETASTKEPEPLDSIRQVIRPSVRKYPVRTADGTGSFFILVANKATKSLYVLQNQDSWRVVKEYEIAVGEQDGRKKTAGDRRTPEGQYFIIGRKERSELNIIYGPLAYVLNYPNEQDHREGRTGQGIWIHGTDPDSVPIDTKGCLEMNNDDLVELSGLLKWGIGTPVCITFDEQMTDPLAIPDLARIQERRVRIIADHERNIEKFNTLVRRWKSAWEQKRIDAYATFYDTVEFRGQGLEWSQWKARKLRTFSLYDTIAITIDNLVVTDVDSQITIVKFLQHYTTNLNNIENGKKLNLEKVDNLWKITGESTCPKEELLL